MRDNLADLKVKLRPIDALLPYARNPRTHSEAQIAQIAASMVEFGWTNPVLVDGRNGVIAGHGRLLAARKLGLKQVPVVELAHLSETQKRAYVIADNQLTLASSWDEEMLRVELEALRDDDFDLGLVGFDPDELAKLLDGEEPDHEGLTDDDAIPEPPDEAVTRRGDLWILGDHRLLCGDSGKGEEVDRLVDGAKIHLIHTDPPYNVKVEPRSNNAIAAGLSSFPSADPVAACDARGLHHQGFDVARRKTQAIGTTRKLRPKDRPLENDFVSEEDFAALLLAWFGNMARVLEPGRGFYIWGGYSNIENYPPVLKQCKLYFSQTVIWVKEHPVLTRKDFMGNHEWCQPGVTQVLTPDGPVPISSLRNGDRVISFRRSDSVLTSRRGSIEVLKTERRYAGPLVRVVAGGRETYCTPGHIWSVRIAKPAREMWCVYLMRRGDWWRIGKSKLLSTWGFGVKHRLKTEDGDAAWILSVHESNLEATIFEQVAQVMYGIPTTTWNEAYVSRRTLGDVSLLYSALNLETMHRGALRALADHGRDLLYPFLDRAVLRGKVGVRVSFSARACNLIPGVMLVPVPVGERGHAPWLPVELATQEPFDGVVHSLAVSGMEHYVADGIVTHNCFYGWREGAAHYFHPEIHNATDVWSVKKVNPQSMVHLTEKPVGLAVRAMTYSSRPGENVLDLFGGSGSTLIGAEKTGRRAYLMELDPLYCDVIIRRWQSWAGQKATRHTDGVSFDEARKGSQAAMR